MGDIDDTRTAIRLYVTFATYVGHVDAVARVCGQMLTPRARPVLLYVSVSTPGQSAGATDDPGRYGRSQVR